MNLTTDELDQSIIIKFIYIFDKIFQCQLNYTFIHTPKRVDLSIVCIQMNRQIYLFV